MVREETRDKPRFSSEQADRLCRTLLPLADSAPEVTKRIQDIGFTAWLPHHMFIESFGTPEDVDCHRRCIIEFARERLGRPFPPFFATDLSHHYFSPYLQELRRKRDVFNGVEANKLSTRYPQSEAAWRRPEDPCERKKIFAHVNDREAYDVAWKVMERDTQRILEAEVERYSTALVADRPFDHQSRFELFKAVMERDAADLGFQYDKAMSRTRDPVFSKELDKDWSLCWSIGNLALFLGLIRGRYTPDLHIRRRQFRGNLAEAKSGEVLFIPYRLLVPCVGSAYGSFRTLGELEVMIKANLSLYRIVAPTLDALLTKGLAEVFA